VKISVRAYIAAGALMNAAALVTIGLLTDYVSSADQPPPAKTSIVVPAPAPPSVTAKL